MKLFIFGATGDLVKRKVIPALFQKWKSDCEIVALGRKELSSEAYRKSLGDVSHFDIPISYQKVSFDPTLTLLDGEWGLSKETLNYFYVALPPAQIISVLSVLLSFKNDGYPLRVLIEKPFGENLESAKTLASFIQEHDLELDVYLSDHYLFKESILKSSFSEFEAMRIVSLESLGLENRASYYEGIGALKDIVQSHFLNIAFRYIENFRKEFSSFSIEKYARGQYEGYKDELGADSATETFVELRLRGATKRFHFVTGKKFDSKISYIEIDHEKLDLTGGEDAYEATFERFFSGRRRNFPTIDHALLAWEIIETIEREKPPLFYYKDGESAKKMLD